jgi:hypothetical protein
MLEMQPSYLVAIMEEVSQLQKVRSGDEGNDKESSSLQVSLKETQHRRDPGSELMFRFKLRFLSRQWNLCVYQSQIGWNCGLRTWNLIPPHTPVWWCIEDDDVNGLRELFETGAASPFDLIDFGSPLGPSTLLSVSTISWMIVLGLTCFNRQL